MVKFHFYGKFNVELFGCENYRKESFQLCYLCSSCSSAKIFCLRIIVKFEVSNGVKNVALCRLLRHHDYQRENLQAIGTFF